VIEKVGRISKNRHRRRASIESGERRLPTCGVLNENYSANFRFIPTYHVWTQLDRLACKGTKFFAGDFPSRMKAPHRRLRKRNYSIGGHAHGRDVIGKKPPAAFAQTRRHRALTLPGHSRNQNGAVSLHHSRVHPEEIGSGPHELETHFVLNKRDQFG
jgi:hypothetical protein